MGPAARAPQSVRPRSGARAGRCTGVRCMNGRVLFAWAVHLYTALGLVCSATRLSCSSSVVTTSRSARRWVSDDGGHRHRCHRWLAGPPGAREVLPHFDGSELDNLIDFHTYTSLPLLLIWRAEFCRNRSRGCCCCHCWQVPTASRERQDRRRVLPWLSSCWNIVAFYLYALHAPLWFSAPVIVVLRFSRSFDALHLRDTREDPSRG